MYLYTKGKPMLAQRLAEIHTMAMTQGRPTPLVIHTQFSNKTDNRRPRLRHHLRATKVCYHETATVEGTTAAQLCHRHRSKKIVVSSWNEALDETGCYIFVVVDSDIAFAQGESAREDLRWDSAKCAEAFRSVEVVGPNNGKPISRQLEMVLIQYMWWLSDHHGISLENWRTLYDTHANIGRFPAPPSFPNQRRGRKSDPKGYSPSNTALKALGLSPGPIPMPMKGIWKVNVTTDHANARKSPGLSAEVIDEVKNGVEVQVVDWKHGDFVGGSDWWGLRKEGGWMALAVLQPVARDDTPEIGVWNVTTTATAINIRAGRTTESKSIGSIANGKPVDIVEWKHGQKVKTTDWWGLRKEGGWISMSVLSRTTVIKQPTLTQKIATTASYYAAMATPSRFMSETYGPGELVTCNHDHDDPSEGGPALLTMMSAETDEETEDLQLPVEGISG